jgi:NADPH2:quinone reductase
MVMTVRIHEYGGPEVLRYEDVPIGSPGPGEVLVRHRAIGLNFADIHTRAGRYPVDSLPHAIGGEACGVVEEIGDDVDQVRVGDRVAYSTGGHALPRGTYTEARILSADRMIVLPDAIGDETAAAMITKGLTAQYLLKDVYKVGPDDTVLIHAAAGGVGLILSQWARHLGARVIGVAGTEAKAALAADHGCHHTITSGTEDIVARVRQLTDGEGVQVVYDAVGRDTFDASLHSLRPRGMLVSYGTASGPIPPFDIFQLNALGSLYLTSAAFYWHMRTREELLDRAADLFEMVLGGAVKIAVNQRYALADVAQAHRDMESRATTGMSVLIP